MHDTEKIKIELSQGSESKNMPEYGETILKSQKTLKMDQKGQRIIHRQSTYQDQTCKAY